MTDTLHHFNKSQPKSILKTSKRLIANSPIFNLDNELYLDIDTLPIKNNNIDNTNLDTELYLDMENNRRDYFPPEPYGCLHSSFNEVPSYLSEYLEREDRFKPSVINPKHQGISTVATTAPKNKRHASDVYILHYTEINKQIIKILLKSIDEFLDEFKEKVGCTQLNDKEVMITHKNELLKELLNFFESDDTDSVYDTISKNLSNPCDIHDMGMGLSEPNILEIKKLRRQNNIEKMQHAKSSASIAKTGLNEPAIYGSLPAPSYLEKITKDLESKRIPVKPFSFGTKQRAVEVCKPCVVSSARTAKKIVRFADSFGFDLEKVKFIGNNSFNEIFSPPTYAIPDIEEEKLTDINDSKPFMVLLPLFSLQKSSQADVIKLDSYVYDYENKMIRCMVKVQNIAFHKRVFARITLNQWKSQYDLNAVYVKSENQKVKHGLDYQNVSFDFFGFCLIVPDKPVAAYKNSHEKTMLDESTTRIEFALCFETDDQSHWDNNFSQNYKFQLFYNMK